MSTTESHPNSKTISNLSGLSSTGRLIVEQNMRWRAGIPIGSKPTFSAPLPHPVPSDPGALGRRLGGTRPRTYSSNETVSTKTPSCTRFYVSVYRKDIIKDKITL